MGQLVGIELRLGQLALTGERQLTQQTPAARQGQRFAVLAQVLAQGLGQGTAAVLAQGKQAAGTLLSGGLLDVLIRGLSLLSGVITPWLPVEVPVYVWFLTVMGVLILLLPARFISVHLTTIASTRRTTSRWTLSWSP